MQGFFENVVSIHLIIEMASKTMFKSLALLHK